MVGSLFDNQSHISPVAIAIPAFTFLCLVAVWGERLMVRGGMYESAAGLKVVNGFGTTLLPWDSITRFERSPAWPTSRVLVVRATGRRTAIVGTAQGARITWDGGETRDIVGELNGRLALWTGEHT